MAKRANLDVVDSWNWNAYGVGPGSDPNGPRFAVVEVPCGVVLARSADRAVARSLRRKLERGYDWCDFCAAIRPGTDRCDVCRSGFMNPVKALAEMTEEEMEAERREEAAAGA